MKDLNKISLDPSTPVLKAMEVINEGAAQIALVLDDQKRLLGTLTDGDIRRGLLNGFSLDSPVELLMNRNLIVKVGDQFEVLEVMSNQLLKQIPVLDEDDRIVKLLLLDELLSPVELSNPVVIMAGGKGTRLRPYTEHCPKPMLRVVGKPMLEILLEQCISKGFRTFYFSVNYLKEQITDYFGMDRWGVLFNIWSRPNHLVLQARFNFYDSFEEPFLVLNGDVLTRLDLGQLLEFHLQPS